MLRLIVTIVAPLVGVGCLGLTSPVVAQPRSPIAQTLSPVGTTQNQLAPDLKTLAAGKVIPGFVTSKTPSATYLSIPSLWWIAQQLAASEQFGDKFVQEWIAYPGQAGNPGRVDLLVNRQLWSASDFIQRYGFVNQFSAIARSYGYNIRVYDNPDRPAAATYRCDFSPADVQILQSSQAGDPQQPTIDATRSPIADQSTCKLQINSTLRSKRPLFPTP